MGPRLVVRSGERPNLPLVRGLRRRRWARLSEGNAETHPGSSCPTAYQAEPRLDDSGECFIRLNIQRSPQYTVHAAQRAQLPLTWFSPPVEAVVRGVAAEQSSATWSHTITEIFEMSSRMRQARDRQREPLALSDSNPDKSVTKIFRHLSSSKRGHELPPLINDNKIFLIDDTDKAEFFSAFFAKHLNTESKPVPFFRTLSERTLSTIDVSSDLIKKHIIVREKSEYYIFEKTLDAEAKMCDSPLSKKLEAAEDLSCTVPSESFEPDKVLLPDTPASHSGEISTHTSESRAEKVPVTSILRRHSLPANLSRSSFSKKVTFSCVDLYHFDRLQGFTCVPSQGGSTLGMATKHFVKENFTVTEHQRQRRQQRNAALLRFCLDGKLLLSLQHFRMLERKVETAKPIQPNEMTQTVVDALPPSDSLHNDGTKENDISTAAESTCPGMQDSSQHQSSATFEVKQDVSLDEIDHSLKRRIHDSPLQRTSFDVSSKDDESEDLNFLESIEDYYFLQPLPVKKRRVLLRRAGLEKIDGTEKSECQAIRISRTQCGCTCPNGVCDPQSCQCSKNGITCQVDRLNFPCTCVSPHHCRNPAGRIEFNPVRVKTHYLHTRMRLELERQREEKRQRNTELCASTHERSGVLPENLLSSTSCNDDKDVLEGALKGADMVSSNSRPFASSELLEPASSLSLANGTVQSSVPYNPAPFFGSPEESEAFLAEHNTTPQGSCRDCQNDPYVHVLIQELAQREPCLQTVQDSSSAEPVEVNPRPDLFNPLSVNAEQECVNNKMLDGNLAFEQGSFVGSVYTNQTDSTKDATFENALAQTHAQSFLESTVNQEPSLDVVDAEDEEEDENEAAETNTELQASGYEAEILSPDGQAVSLLTFYDSIVRQNTPRESERRSLQLTSSCPTSPQQACRLEPIASLFHPFNSPCASSSVETGSLLQPDNAPLKTVEPSLTSRAVEFEGVHTSSGDNCPLTPMLTFSGASPMGPVQPSSPGRPPSANSPSMYEVVTA
ncbi:positive regulation of transcription by RNA polymerase II [Sparganum proliferum]